MSLKLSDIATDTMLTLGTITSEAVIPLSPARFFNNSFSWLRELPFKSSALILLATNCSNSLSKFVSISPN